MGFWEDGIGKLETHLNCLLIYNIFSLRRTFQRIVRILCYLVLLKCARCIRIEACFFCITEIQWVVSFIVYAF